MHFNRYNLTAHNITQLEGVILAHDLKFSSIGFKKGQILSIDDLELILANGLDHIYGAQLEDSDIGEDEAAKQLATALENENIISRKSQGGRYSLVAAANGLFAVNKQAVDDLNLLGGEITISTLPEWQTVAAGQIVATVKVIPFSTSKVKLEQAVTLAKKNSLVSIKPFVKKNVSLIQTYNQKVQSKQLLKTIEVTEQRLTTVGSSLAFEKQCPHQLDDIKHNLSDALASQSDLILIIGATMTVDQQDIIPQAIIELGGHIEHFGMPVQPGNMLLVGQIGECRIINMPGCSRSIKDNGFDRVLTREFANLPVNKTDILSMGVGGLIVNQEFDMPTTKATNKGLAKANKVAAVILAGGRSQRMGKDNKLLANIAGQPMLHWAIESAKQAQIDNIVVVSGHQSENVEKLANKHSVNVVHNSDYASGIASSIKAGLTAIEPDVDGVFVILGDMPFVASEQLDAMIQRLKQHGESDHHDRKIIVPFYRAQRGNPILWSAHFINKLKTLTGDIGARNLLKKYQQDIIEIEFNDDAVIIDIDTPQVLASYKDSSAKIKS